MEFTKEELTIISNALRDWIDNEEDDIYESDDDPELPVRKANLEVAVALEERIASQ